HFRFFNVPDNNVGNFYFLLDLHIRSARLNDRLTGVVGFGWCGLNRLSWMKRGATFRWLDIFSFASGLLGTVACRADFGAEVSWFIVSNIKISLKSLSSQRQILTELNTRKTEDQADHCNMKQYRRCKGPSRIGSCYPHIGKDFFSFETNLPHLNRRKQIV